MESSTAPGDVEKGAQCGKPPEIELDSRPPRDIEEKSDRESAVGSVEEVDEEEDGEESSPSDAGENGNGGSGAGAVAGLTRVLSRVLSRSSASAVPSPPPDGGMEAWVAVACSHLVNMITWGFINSFGVFQAYYATSLNRPPADISWIGSFQVFLLFFTSALAGRLTDAGYFRQVFFVGSVLQLMGIFASSWADGSYWQLFLSQGVCMGIGNGCMFCPCMAIVSTYFSKKRALAMGMAACGTATGGLIFPSLARQLLPTAGFAWAIRAIGFVQLASLVICNLFLRPRVAPRKSGQWLDLAAFKELEYTFYTMGAFLCWMALYFGFYYIATFSREFVGLSYQNSLDLLLVLNGVGLVGRLILNSLADRVGALTVFVPAAVIAGVCVLCWMAVDSVPGLYVWAVFYGMTAGGMQSLFPAGLSSLTTDLRKAGVRMGMVFSIISFATLVGPPIAGAIITASGGKYQAAQAYAGSLLILGSGFIVAARMVKMKKVKGGWKAKI